MNLTVLDYYKGLPADVDSRASHHRKDVWEAHMGLFITVLVLLAICIIVIIIGLLCLKCTDRKTGEKVDMDFTLSIAYFKLGFHTSCLFPDSVLPFLCKPQTICLLAKLLYMYFTICSL